MHTKSCYLYFIQQQTLKVALHFNYKSLSLHFIYSGLQKQCLYDYINLYIQNIYVLLRISWLSQLN